MSHSALRKYLQNLREYPAHHERCFIPEGSWEHLFTKDLIYSLLSECPAGGLGRIVDEVHSMALKVLAILIWMDSDVKLLRSFLDEGLYDRRLPFTKEDLSLDLREKLGEKLVNGFLHVQHTFLAPVFSKGVDCDSMVLPFIESEFIGWGAFGIVYKIRIHPNHQRLQVPPNQVEWFARKEFTSLNCEEIFKKEKGVLQQLLKLEHPNIVPLLATYSHNSHFNMIFPLADMTLHDYLRSDSHRCLDDRSIRSLFRKVYELAKALDHIHNFSLVENGEELKLLGYHHDLKPRNILVLDKRFMIADFGLANLKNVDQPSGTAGIGTGAYSPPEVRHGKVGRAYDIWSFGCILAELATFAVMGAEGIEAFSRSRITKVSLRVTNDYFHDGTKVKLEVMQHFRELKLMAINRSGPQAIVSQVLDLVDHMLEPVVSKRLVSRDVLEKLGKILDPSSPIALSPSAPEPPSHLQTKQVLNVNQKPMSEKAVEKILDTPNHSSPRTTLSPVPSKSQYPPPENSLAPQSSPPISSSNQSKFSAFARNPFLISIPFIGLFVWILLVASNKPH